MKRVLTLSAILIVCTFNIPLVVMAHGGDGSEAGSDTSSSTQQSETTSSTTKETKKDSNTGPMVIGLVAVAIGIAGVSRYFNGKNKSSGIDEKN